jgi:hypothetical protein
MPQGVEGYIVDFEDTTQVVKFLYYEDITEDFGANYDAQSVRGRSEPHIFYSDSNPNTYTFQIKLAASVDEKDHRDAKQIYKEYLFIKSFSYPDYGIQGAGPVRPPHKVIVHIGDWFSEMGIIIQPHAVHSKVCDEDGFPLFIDVSFTFQVVNQIPKSYRNIRGLE